MTTARVIWPPYPHSAGFTVTDDTDAATFEQVRAVYDFLLATKFHVTKTVWAFPPVEECGIPATPDSTLRGVTLDDPRYREYCEMLSGNGFEICLHGASAGNNPREQTRRALELLEGRLGGSDTFVCHAKNADNIYWEHKVTSLGFFRWLLRLYSKHSCFGEDPGSPYFWGDICHRRLNQIRLYRTRCVNTLKRNPSMPYFSPDKPLVNGWFSATKRPIAECATPDQIHGLVAENGLTVLYQYMHRYADPETLTLNRRFTDAVHAIVSDGRILVDTVTNHMRRLRLIQGLFLVHEGRQLWLVNTSVAPIESLQIRTDRRTSVASTQCRAEVRDRTLIVHDVPASGIVRVETAEPLRFGGDRAIPANGSRRLSHRLRMGRLRVNLSESEWQVDERTSIGANRFHLEAPVSGTGQALLSTLPLREEVPLIVGQFLIIAREILFRGRSMDISKFLDASKGIRLEDHDTW